MVTAETAVLLPLIAAMVAGALWVVMLGYTQIRLVDASRDVARLVARGVPADVALARERDAVHGGISFAVQRTAGYVVVEAKHRATAPLPGLDWSMKARATCVDEQ